MSKKPSGYWRKWENVEEVLRSLMAENGGLIPPASTFRARGLQGLLVTITHVYGGLGAVRKRLGVADAKLCTSCRTVQALGAFRTHKTKKGMFRDSVCVACSNSRVADYRSTWKGRAAELFRRAQERAKGLGREFELTPTWIFDRLVKAEFKCEASGVALVADTRGRGTGFRNRFGASLDRIDSSRGYTTDNVRVVANRMNIALGDLSDDQFEEFAAGFLRRRGWVVLRQQHDGLYGPDANSKEYL